MNLSKLVNNPIFNFLFPQTKDYAVQSAQETMSQQPYARYAAGQPDANLAKFILEKGKQEFGRPAQQAAMEIAPWLIPFGKGTSLASKTLAPGALVGGMGALSEDKVTPTSLALGLAGGAGGAYGLDKAGALASKGVGKLTTGIPEEIMNKLLRPSQVKSTKAEIKGVLKGNESLGKWALNKPEFRASSFEDMLKNVTGKIDDLETSIQSAIQNSTETVSKNDVVKKIMPYYNNLIKSGNQETANSLLDRVNQIFAQGEFLDLPTANGVKRAIYKEARNSYDRLGSESAEGLKKIGNALMTGIEKGEPAVKQINKEYANFIKAEDSLLNQVSRGKRNVPLGVIDMLAGGIGATAGGFMGGPYGGFAGAMTTIGAKKLIDNPGNEVKLAQMLAKAGNLPGVGLSPSLKGQLGARTGAAITGLFAGRPDNINGPENQTNQTGNQNYGNQINPLSGSNLANNTPYNNNVKPTDGQLSPQGQWIYSAEQNDWIPNPQYETGETALAGGFNEEQRKQIAMLSVTMKPAEFKQLQEAYKIMTGEDLIPSDKAQKYPSSMVSRVADFDASSAILNDLEASINSNLGTVMGPLSGTARRANPYDVSAQDFESQMRAAAQIVGKAMEGGVLRAEDVPKYRAILPNISDTKETAMRKINNVKQLIELQKQSQIGAFSTYQGYDTAESSVPTIE